MQTHPAAPCDDGGRDGSDASTSQGTPRIAGHHEKPGGKQGRVLFRAFRENVALLTPSCPTSDLQNCERSLSYFNHQVVGMTADMGY